MISTDSKRGAARAANFIIITAPIPKLGAMRTPTSGRAAHQPATTDSLSSVNPVVPTTAWIPDSMANSRVAITASGVVKSTMT